MLLLLWTLCLCLPWVRPETHSLQYYYTTMFRSADFPEFVHVGVLDDVQITYFDSKTEKDIARQPWMERELGSDYWDMETQRLINRHKLHMANVQIAMQRCNGNKTEMNYLQYTSGCSITDNGEVSGVRQYAFNGEDLISFDFQQSIWVTASPLALSTRDKWNSDTANNVYKKHYTEKICVKWLKIYLEHGHAALSRKDEPDVTVYSRSSPDSQKRALHCLATGFFPQAINMSWFREGQPVPANKNSGVLPNHDGTYQMKITLLMAPAESREHACRVWHSSKPEEMDVVWDQGGRVPLWLAVPAMVLFLVALGAVFYFWKQFSGVVKGSCCFGKGSSGADSSSSGSASSQSLQQNGPAGGVDRNEKEKMLPKSVSPVMHGGVEWLLSWRSLAAKYLSAMPGRSEGAQSPEKLAGSRGLADQSVRHNRLIQSMACEEDRGMKMSSLRFPTGCWPLPVENSAHYLPCQSGFRPQYFTKRQRRLSRCERAGKMESFNVPVSLLFALSSLCSVSGDHADSHSLIYFSTNSLSLPDLPAFSRVGMLDDLQIDYYDSSLKEVVPRQQWIANGFTAEYWTRQKEIADTIQKIVSEQLSGFGVMFGISYFQGIWGCTQSESMIHLFVKFGIQDLAEMDCDLVTMTCSATGIFGFFNNPLYLQTFFTNAAVQAVKNSCIRDLQEALRLGDAALERKVVPEVTVLKRESMADKGTSLQCVITPFYPRAINATWLRDGQVVSDGMNKNLLPNQDDTYRMELLIELHGQDPKFYSCQVQHSSLSETLTMTLRGGGVGGSHEAFGASSMLVLMATLVMIVGAL
ncbi:uncharacterized protein LOC144602948 [Rhinoraja longicauda]